MPYEKSVAYENQTKEELHKRLIGESKELVLYLKPYYKNIKLREGFDEERYHHWAFAHTDAKTEIAIRPREQIPYRLIVIGDKIGWEGVLGHEKEHVLNPDEPREYVIDLLGGRRERDYIRSSKVRLY